LPSGKGFKFKYAAFLSDCVDELSILDGSAEGSTAALLVFDLLRHKHTEMATLNHSLLSPPAISSVPKHGPSPTSDPDPDLT